MANNSSFNTSLTEFGIGIPYPEGIRIFLILLSFVVILLGVPGNLLVIGTILKVKTLRIRLNMFIINLAIADTILVGYVLPFTTADYILGRYPVNKNWCVFNFIVTKTIFTVEATAIALISISRYFKICKENVFPKVFTPRVTLILCILPWVVGALFSLHVLINPQVSSYNRFIHVCLMDNANIPFYTRIVPVVVISGCIITSICYWKILGVVQESDRRIRRHGNETFARLRHNITRRQVLSNFVIFLLFIFLQTPGVILHTAFSHSSAVLQSICSLLYMVNSSINCIVYGVMNKKIRKQYKSIMPAVHFIQVQPAITNTEV